MTFIISFFNSSFLAHFYRGINSSTDAFSQEPPLETVNLLNSGEMENINHTNGNEYRDNSFLHLRNPSFNNHNNNGYPVFSIKTEGEDFNYNQREGSVQNFLAENQFIPFDGNNIPSISTLEPQPPSPSSPSSPFSNANFSSTKHSPYHGNSSFRVKTQPKQYQVVNYNIFPPPEIEFDVPFSDPITIQAFLMYDSTQEIQGGFTNGKLSISKRFYSLILGDVVVLKPGQTKINFPALHLNRMTPIKNTVQTLSGAINGANFSIKFKVRSQLFFQITSQQRLEKQLYLLVPLNL
jgi:hypothetical protein